MPRYSVDGCDVEVARDSLLIDTGVLVGAFMPRDDKHFTAQMLLEDWTEQFIIPVAVVIEAWGFMVGSRKDLRAGLDLFDWLFDPGHRVLLIPQMELDLAGAQATARAMQVDCIDAFLLHLADRLTDQCKLGTAIRIATCDKRDFLRCAGAFRFNLVCLTPDDIEEISWQ